MELTFNGEITPETISKTKLTPVTLSVSGVIRRLDELFPPGLEGLVLAADKNTTIDVAGVPTCPTSKLRSRDTKQAKAICRSAMIGSGQMSILTLSLPRPTPETSNLIVFNGGKAGATTTLYIHSYFTFPVPATVVSTVKITKVKSGRYGTKSVIAIPKITKGSSSITDFDLTVSKRGGLLARCPDGKLRTRVTATFSTGISSSARVVRPCTGRG